MNKLNIFVSSTCYDLSQVRTDLFESITDLGFTPVLSEFGTFPINPSNNTVENCIDAIKSSADIFILLIGSRYGYKLEGGKSITNMEFLTAKNKNIPIYVFISKQIINLLPVYLKNPSADYSNIVDTPKIFEFANEIRNTSGLWSFEFEKFQDIIMILKTQLSYLFKESLSIRNKFYTGPNHDFYSSLSNKALKIVLLKEDIYEYEYLAQVFVDEISKCESLKKDYEYKIILKNNKVIQGDSDFFQWATNRLAEVRSFTPTLVYLVNVLIPKYLNEPGKPADLKGLFYVAKTYARTYETFINWSIETLSVVVEDNHKELRNILAELNSSTNELIWQFPFMLQENTIDAKRKLQAGEEKIQINMNLKLEIDPEILDKYNKEIDKFKEK